MGSKSPNRPDVVGGGLAGEVLTPAGEELEPRAIGIGLRRTPAVGSRKTTNCGLSEVQLIKFVGRWQIPILQAAAQISL